MKNFISNRFKVTKHPINLIRYCLGGVLFFIVLLLCGSVVAQPTITSVSPMIDSPGTSITITGTNFNATAANDIVYFGATKATVTAASTTTLKVTVPVGATYAPITVNNTATHLVAYSDRFFLPDYNNSAYMPGAINFDPQVDFATYNIGPLAVAISDIDGDGKADVVVINNNPFSTGYPVSIYRNISSIGSISASSLDTPVTVATTVDFTAPQIGIGDIDGDGKPDLVFTSNQSVYVFLNTSTAGTISFSAGVNILTSPTALFTGIAIGDIDGDGKSDIATVNGLSNQIVVIRNTSTIGSVSFSDSTGGILTTFTTGDQPYAIVIGDIDGDGKPDLAVGNESEWTVSVFHNKAITGTIDTSSFSAQVIFATGSTPLGIMMGDIDGDGKPELATVNEAGTYGFSVSVLLNTSTPGSIDSSSFAAQVLFATGGFPVGAALGDIDGDGKPDIAVSNSTDNTVSVLRNTSSIGSVSFASEVLFTCDTIPDMIAIGDIDGDGKPDLAVINHEDKTLSILRNDPLSNPTFTTLSTTGRAEVLLYPNPTNDVIDIKANVAGIFFLYSLDGKCLGQYNINEGVTNLSLPNELVTGICMGRYVGNDGNTALFKIVKE